MVVLKRCVFIINVIFLFYYKTSNNNNNNCITNFKCHDVRVIIIVLFVKIMTDKQNLKDLNTFLITWLSQPPTVIDMFVK